MHTTLPLQRAAYNALHRVDDGLKGYSSKAFKKYSEKIGPRKMTHTARRQCISSLRNSHVISVDAIRDFAGHEDISTTDSYTYDTSKKVETNEKIKKVVDSSIFHGVSPLSPND